MRIGFSINLLDQNIKQFQNYINLMGLITNRIQSSIKYLGIDAYFMKYSTM